MDQVSLAAGTFVHNVTGTVFTLNNMGLDVTKPVFGVSDKMRFKPACSATQTI